jgi:hypothetical protein
MSRFTALRMGAQLFCAGIARSHAFDPKLKIGPEVLLRYAKKEGHLEGSILLGCLLQVTKNREPWSREVSYD